MPARDDRRRILIVDDRLEMAEMLADGLRDRHYEAAAVASSRAAVARLREEPFDAVVTDLRMPEIDGMEVLAASRKLDPDRPVIVMTAYGAIDSAIDSIRLGAYHYLTKPFMVDELDIFLRRAFEERAVRQEAATLRSTLRERFSGAGLVAKSAPMRGLLELLGRIATSDVPVLLSGETGTGKGLIARLIHAESVRAGSPFVSVNCAALPEALLESELFGHLKGAFTGASADRPGLFAEADQGTIFLDEIGEMPLALQAKLLHVLERKSVRPVGATRERAVDARIIAATHKPLREGVRGGTFREDLLYRLDVVSVDLPPLRARREDLPELVGTFLAAARERHPRSPVERLAPGVVTAFLEYQWPGNVRELAHTIERMVVLGRSREVGTEEIPPSIRCVQAAEGLFGSEVEPMRQIQRKYAHWALGQCDGHRGRTADRMGIDGKTLARLLSERGDDPEETQAKRHGEPPGT